MTASPDACIAIANPLKNTLTEESANNVNSPDSLKGPDK